MDTLKEHDVGVLGDPALKGLRQLLVVEALTELLEQELGREDGRHLVGETVVQDAEQGRLHGRREPVIAQVIDEEDGDAGPIGHEGELPAAIGGLDGPEHQLMRGHVGPGHPLLLAPAPQHVEGGARLAGAGRTAQPEPAASQG